MRETVFIQTNERQYIGALVSEYSLRRNSRNADKFDVRIMQVRDFPFIAAREGQPFLREGRSRVWTMNDLQSFTPVRFAPPELMGYEGRAVVIDPDVFAAGDIWELFQKDMQDKALLCRARPGHNGRPDYLASSVMLLDCAKLTHWQLEKQFNEMFDFKRDYLEWIYLKLEPPGSIGFLENHWNDFDHLDENTRLLHNTKRKTQPWKTGLPVDFTVRERRYGFVPTKLIKRARHLLGMEGSARGSYKPHPDPNQEAFFFGLLRECVDQGIVTEDMLRDEMRRNHIRHDAFEVMDRVPKAQAA